MQNTDKDASIHIPVLLHEIVEALVGKFEIRNSKFEFNPWLLDGTLGGGGHALAIAQAFKSATDKALNVIGLDQDPQAIEWTHRILKENGEGRREKGGSAGQLFSKVILENENFRNLDKVLEKNGIQKVDMILFDLGISSDELEHSGRGFTFQKDEPLQMTLGDPATYPFTAATIVNEWSEEAIADVIFGYGEDRYARRIAKALVGYREKTPIRTSAELAEVVKSAVPGLARRAKIHPATKIFQALRIAVNDELNALREGLTKGYERLNCHGRMAVISFHSLEDRIAKNFYKVQEKKGALILTKKPITAGPQEIAENPRSRSAKLRIIQKQES